MPSRHHFVIRIPRKLTNEHWIGPIPRRSLFTGLAALPMGLGMVVNFVHGRAAWFVFALGLGIVMLVANLRPAGMPAEDYLRRILEFGPAKHRYIYRRGVAAKMARAGIAVRQATHGVTEEELMGSENEGNDEAPSNVEPHLVLPQVLHRAPNQPNAPVETTPPVWVRVPGAFGPGFVFVSFILAGMAAYATR